MDLRDFFTKKSQQSIKINVVMQLLENKPKQHLRDLDWICSGTATTPTTPSGTATTPTTPSVWAYTPTTPSGIMSALAINTYGSARFFRKMLTKIDQNRSCYATFGHQDLSRSLDRIENIQFATWIAQNHNRNASKLPPEKCIRTPNKNNSKKHTHKLRFYLQFPQYCLNLKR